MFFLINIVTFSQKPLWFEFTVIIGILAFMVACRCLKQAFEYGVLYIVVLLLQYYVFPYAPPMVLTIFIVSLLYLRKIFLCIMIGVVLAKKIPMQYGILTMRKWHLPQKLIIALSVTLRYFPAIKEETRHIREAMSLRGIKGARMFECFIVPLMMSAINTAGELTAAAVTRGVDNPIKKTSAFSLKLRGRDYVCLGMLAVFIFFTFII
jgi:energy-coupling factor transport system permease protein